jgi:hypothetical protein
VHVSQQTRRIPKDPDEKCRALIEENDQTIGKDNDAEYGRGDSGQENRTGGDIECGPGPSLRRFVQAVENCFDGAIKEFGCQNQADAPQEDTPFKRLALKCPPSREYERGQEEMNKKTGMASNAEFQSAKRVMEFVPPRPSWFTRTRFGLR